MRKIRDELEAVRQRRAQQRAARQAAALATIALVGYTNAGKSTLFNALTQAEVHVSKQMFATLDPTIRALTLPSGRRVLLADTVGFLRHLPPGLVAAFRATLEEVQQATILLQVSDLANPHHQEQDAEVEKILAELGVADKPRLHVFNKLDLLPKAERLRLHNHDHIAFTSALNGIGLAELRSQLEQFLPGDRRVRLRLKLSPAQGRELARLHAQGAIISQEYRDGCLILEAEIPETIAPQFAAYKI